MRCFVLLLISMVASSQAIYLRDEDRAAHEGLHGMENPGNARMLNLHRPPRPNHMKEDMATTPEPGDEGYEGEGEDGGSGHPITPTNYGKDDDDRQCTYTFQVPQSQSHQCADGAKIHALESKIDELTSCVDKLKYKSNVLFVTSLMKSMGGRGEGGHGGGSSGDKMMDMMMGMLDDNDNRWGKRDHDDDDKRMKKMMKMLKAWMDEDDDMHRSHGKSDKDSDEDSSEDSDEESDESSVPRHDNKQIIRHISKLRNQVESMQETLDLKDQLIETFTDEIMEIIHLNGLEVPEGDSEPESSADDHGFAPDM